MSFRWNKEHSKNEKYNNMDKLNNREICLVVVFKVLCSNKRVTEKLTKHKRNIIFKIT